MTQVNDHNRYIQNNNRQVTRFKFILIWGSEEEARVKSTDPEIIERLIDSISRTYQDCEIDRKTDLADQVHFFSIKKMDPATRHREICWWMFKILCERGWEPMEVKSNEYKLKYCEMKEIGSQ